MRCLLLSAVHHHWHLTRVRNDAENRLSGGGSTPAVSPSVPYVGPPLDSDVVTDDNGFEWVEWKNEMWYRPSGSEQDFIVHKDTE